MNGIFWAAFRWQCSGWPWETLAKASYEPGAKGMKKHRILLVVRHPVGGIRTFFRYVYRNFGSEKYQFTLVAPDLPETRVLLEDLKGLELVYTPTARNVSNKEFFRLVTKTIRKETFRSCAFPWLYLRRVLDCWRAFQTNSSHSYVS